MYIPIYYSNNTQTYDIIHLYNYKNEVLLNYDYNKS